MPQNLRQWRLLIHDLILSYLDWVSTSGETMPKRWLFREVVVYMGVLGGGGGLGEGECYSSVGSYGCRSLQVYGEDVG